MPYRTVLFTVPVQEGSDDPKEWIRKELDYEHLLDTLLAASVPEPARGV